MLHSYFDRKYDKVLTFTIVHFPNLEISAFLLLASYLAVSKFNKRRGHLLDEIRYLQYEGCFGFRRVANAKESRLCARPYPTQDKLLTAFHSALNMCLSKEITLSLSLSLTHTHTHIHTHVFATRWNPKHSSYCKYSVLFIIRNDHVHAKNRDTCCKPMTRYFDRRFSQFL